MPSFTIELHAFVEALFGQQSGNARETVMKDVVGAFVANYHTDQDSPDRWTPGVQGTLNTGYEICLNRTQLR